METPTSSLASPVAVSPWLSNLRTLFSEHESQELTRLRERTPFSRQVDTQTARDNLIFMLNASLVSPLPQLLSLLH